MQFTLYSADRLPGDLVRGWERLHAEDASLASPLQRPEFVRAVADVRSGVEVAVLQRAGGFLGCLPFRRTRPRCGEPLAGNFSDLQGFFGRAEPAGGAAEWLAACELSQLRFRNVPAEQSPFVSSAWRWMASPFIDLSPRQAASRRERGGQDMRELRETERKRRKLAREAGPLRFEFCSPEPRVWQQIFAWKEAQVRRLRWRSEWQQPWCRSLVERCLQEQSGGFAGVVSALWVQDELLAGAISLRSASVLHGWVTAYNREFARYSPGSILLIELMAAAAEQGIRRIDMGPGAEPYKRRFATGMRPLIEGALDAYPWRAWWGRQQGQLRQHFRQLTQSRTLPGPAPQGSAATSSPVDSPAPAVSNCPVSLRAASLRWRVPNRVLDAWRDWRWGVQTQGDIPGDWLGYSPACFGYQPIPYRTLDAIFAELAPHAADHVFCDYGCGMGRVVLAAAGHNFRRVLGVERCPGLAAVARTNVQQAASRLRCRDVQILTADAVEFELPADVTIVFLFNPFDAALVRAVADRWQASLIKCPRPFRVIQILPRGRPDALRELNWLATVPTSLSAQEEPWQQIAVYEAVRDASRAHPAAAPARPPGEPSGAPVGQGARGARPPSVPARVRDIRVLPVASLTDSHRAAWRAIQQAEPSLDSPFFAPEFIQALALVRPQVATAVLCDGADVVGFFPFQRSGSAGRAAGYRLSDYQGVVVRRETAWDPVELLRGCGLRSWEFDHVPTAQTRFETFAWCQDVSPYLDLREGFSAYSAALPPSSQQARKQIERKARKLAREVGPLRFEVHRPDEVLLATLLDWKSAQYRRTGITDVLSFEWTQALLRAVLRQATGDFAGVLSVLHAGPHLVAMHLGMRCRGVLHWWFPVYSVAYAAYSPGRILLDELAQAAPSLGVHKIDLGRGLVPYKKQVMSNVTPLWQGRVDPHFMAHWLHKSRWQVEAWLRESRWRPLFRVPARGYRRWMEGRDFHVAGTARQAPPDRNRESGP